MGRFLSEEDSICAIATPPGHGGIGVIRLSGEDAHQFILPLCSFLPETLESHKVYYGLLKNNDEALDEVLVTYFQKGRSFTGDETFEISFHGNPLIGKQILRALIEKGARAAGPGEFTYRAFMNGRIDLTQAEAVLSLIESRTELAGKQALRQVCGSLKEELAFVEEALTLSLAHMEANLDFAAEDIVIEQDNVTIDRLSAVKTDLDRILSGYKRGKLLNHGFQVAIVGAPNVGKSSLLNRLLGEDRAIVTDVPGTTRDVVTGDMIMDGYMVSFSDTAGIRETTDVVEQIGIEKTRTELENADLIWLLEEPGQPADEVGFDEKCVRIRNKSDLATSAEFSGFSISAKTGDGIEALLEELRTRLIEQGEESSPALLQSRHFELLSDSSAALERGLNLLRESASPEFVIAEIQDSLQFVMEVLGKRFDDEVMDRVFKEFCLGK